MKGVSRESCRTTGHGRCTSNREQGGRLSSSIVNDSRDYIVVTACTYTTILIRYTRECRQTGRSACVMCCAHPVSSAATSYRADDKTSTTGTPNNTVAVGGKHPNETKGQKRGFSINNATVIAPERRPRI